jgi:hypothetical protein
VYVARLDANGVPEFGTFYGGFGNMADSSPYWSIYNGGEMLTTHKVRDGRLFIAGSTAGWWGLPLSIAGGTALSFLQTAPPNNQIADPDDITHGFMAQLSWLYTGMEELERATGEGALVPAVYDPITGNLTLALPDRSWSGEVQVSLFSSDGRRVIEQRVRFIGGNATMRLPFLASGLYAGACGSHGVFKLVQP